MNPRDQAPLDPEERALAQLLSRLDAQAAPSPALDARILAAARDALPAAASPPPPHHVRRPRWPVGMGIAASLAVAVGVAWQLRPQPETHILVASQEAPASQAAASSADTVPTQHLPPPPRVADDPAPMIAAETAAASPAPAAVPAPPIPAADATSITPEAPASTIAAQDTERAVRARLDAQAKRTTEAARAEAARAVAERADLRRASETIASDTRETAPTPPAPPPPPAPQAPSPAAQPTTSMVEPAAAGSVAPAPPRSGSAATALGVRPQARMAAPTPRAAAAAATAPTAAIAVEAVATAAPDFAADQPLDDQPPASADSPEVRARWLQRIRELRADGEADEARASLREFLRRHPEAEVPDDLRRLLDE